MVCCGCFGNLGEAFTRAVSLVKHCTLHCTVHKLWTARHVLMTWRHTCVREASMKRRRWTHLYERYVCRVKEDHHDADSTPHPRNQTLWPQKLRGPARAAGETNACTATTTRAVNDAFTASHNGYCLKITTRAVINSKLSQWHCRYVLNPSHFSRLWYTLIPLHTFPLYYERI